MEIDKNVAGIIKKLKSSCVNKDEVSNQVFDSIQEALKLIFHAKLSMKEVADKGLIDTSGVSITYGFVKNRLGEIKAHPGTVIIKDNQAIIDRGLKLLSVKPNEGDEKKTAPLSKLRKLSS